MIGVDTNILVRYFKQDDPVQSKVAADVVERHLTEDVPGFVSLVTIAELVWVLTSTYRHTREEVLLVLERMLQADNLVIASEQEVFYAAMALKAGQGSFPDALIANLNTAAGCTLTLTFDKKAARLPGFRLL